MTTPNTPAVTPGTAACDYKFTTEPRPCSTCPYLANAPSGLWSADEYAKLVEYDAEFVMQPNAMFLCHTANTPGRQTDTLCAGWVAVHADNSLAIRLAMMAGKMNPDDVLTTCLDVKLHPSGTAAADHGMRDINNPGRKALAAIDKINEMRGMVGVVFDDEDEDDE